MSNQLIGVMPLLVLKIVDRTEQYPDPLYFSTAEIVESGSPFNAPVYGLIQSFGTYSSVQDVGGFSNVGSMRITANDSVGFWRSLVRSRDLGDFDITIYLVIREPSGRNYVRPIIKGKIALPIAWLEASRTFEFDVVENLVLSEFGYTPEFDEYPYISENLNSEAKWGHVFGAPALTDVGSVCTVPTLKLNRTIIYLYGRTNPEDPDEIIYPPTGPGTRYENDENYVYVLAGQQAVSLWPVDDDGAAKMPPNNCWADLGLTQDGQSARMYGKAVQINERWFFQLVSGFNTPYYTDIVLIAAPQRIETVLGPASEDRVEYAPLSVQMRGFGSYTGPPSFNIHGELVGLPDVEEEFSAYDMPWLVGCYIRMTCVATFRDAQGTYQHHTRQCWAYVQAQENASLLLADIRDDDDQETSLSGYMPVHLHYAQRNKIFQPNSQNLFPVPPIKSQDEKRSGKQVVQFNVIEADEEGEPLVVDAAFVLAEGAPIRLTDWWAQLVFPISLDDITVVQQVFIRVGNRLHPLSSFHHYKVWKQVDGTYTQLQGLVEVGNFPDPAMATIEAEHFPDRWVFVQLRVGSTLLRLQGEENITLVVYATNALATDEAVFEWVVNNYTNYTGVQHVDIAKHRPVGFWTDGSETVADFLGGLCKEHGKAIQIKLDTARTVDLLIDETPARVFNERNTAEGTYTWGYSEPTTYANKVKASFDWDTGFLTFSDPISIARYGEQKEDTSFKYNRYRDTLNVDGDLYAQADWVSAFEEVDARGYNRVLAYQLQQSAFAHAIVTLTTYLDTWVKAQDHLVANEYVLLSYVNPLNDLSSVINPLYAKPVALWGLADLEPIGMPVGLLGRITEVQVNPTDWLVTVKIATRKQMGT